MLQSVSSVFVVYRHKTLTGSLDPTHANGTNKPCITFKSSVHAAEVECSRFPEYPVSRIAVHSSSVQILFCDIQLRSTIQWIQPLQPVFLLRQQHSIQRYNGLHNWFDRNRSSNGLDQRCQDLRSLPELEGKSGIDLQFSSI